MPHLLRALPLAAIPAAFLCLLTAIPLWKMLDYGGSPLWLEMLHDSYYRQRILWTATQAACTVLLTLLLGLPCAWALARLQFSGKALILRLLMLPFIMPTLVAGMGVLALFGEKGLLWRGWQDTAVLLLYGNIFFNLPVLIRSAYQGLLAVPANRIAAAKTLGANAWQQFWHVELPVLRPWLASAGCLIFLYCFSGFGLALLLGGQQYATAEVEIYRLIAHELDLERASVLVWLVLFATTAAGLLNAWFSRQTHARRHSPDCRAKSKQPAPQNPARLHPILADRVLRPTLAGDCGASHPSRQRVARVMARRHTFRTVEHAAIFHHCAIWYSRIRHTPRRSRSRHTAVSQHHIFTVYDFARVFIVWRAAGISTTRRQPALAARAVCIARLSFCYQRRFDNMGRTAPSLFPSRTSVWRKPNPNAVAHYLAAAAPCITARFDLCRCHQHRRICRHALFIAPRMANAHHADLLLFEQSR